MRSINLLWIVPLAFLFGFSINSLINNVVDADNSAGGVSSDIHFQGHNLGSVSLEDRQVVCDKQAIWNNRNLIKDLKCKCFSSAVSDWDACWTFPVRRVCSGILPSLTDRGNIEYVSVSMDCLEVRR